MNQQNNNYNLQELIKETIVCALNDFDTIKEAAQRLGISEKTVYRYKNMYNIKKTVDIERGLIYKSHEIQKVKTYHD